MASIYKRGRIWWIAPVIQRRADNAAKLSKNLPWHGEVPADASIAVNCLGTYNWQWVHYPCRFAGARYGW